MNKLLECIEQGVSPFHVVEYGMKELIKAGFQELKYDQAWDVELGHAYVVAPFPSMLVAIIVGEKIGEQPLRLATAHTDSPSFKIKSRAKLSGEQYLQYNIEPYGGMLKETWFDRPLAIAGKVVIPGEHAFSPKEILVDSQKAVCVIPSLAPHMRREKGDINPQKEMMPIFGLQQEEVSFQEYIGELFHMQPESILAYDLYLYEPQKGIRLGVNQEMLQAPRIDNLASVAALIEAMEQAVQKGVSGLAVAVGYDHEEVGSRSKQGADSMLLNQLLEKLRLSLGIDQLTWNRAYEQGFLLSLDGAQGYHPNYREKSDPTNPVYLGQGIALKQSASQRYLSDSKAAAIIKELCSYGNIKLQEQVNQSGNPGGQTLGPILASYFPMMGADVGIPMLAMHSTRELAAWRDYEDLVTLAAIFFSM